MTDNHLIEAYWQKYLAGLGETHPDRAEDYIVDSFGDSPELAEELVALVLAGVKTATCSALWEWQAEGGALPTVGLKTIVLNGKGTPVCILETSEVTILAYEAVDASFAYDEGEGDRSLEYWRQAHWRYFSRTLPRIGKAPSLEMPLVCERFRVIDQMGPD